MARVYQGTKAIFPNARIGVIYGDTGRTPGIDQVTDAGRDKYGSGPQGLNLRADQHLMIVAGGANPYREDVQPYVDYAEAHPVDDDLAAPETSTYPSEGGDILAGLHPVEPQPPAQELDASPAA